MPEGHAVAAIFDHILFIQAMLRAPAEVNAFAAPLHAVAADNRALRAGSGMEGQPGSVEQMTVLDQNIVGKSPDDAVTVEISDRDLAHDDAIAFIQTDTAVIERPLVEHLVVRLVPVDRDILNHALGYVGALD